MFHVKHRHPAATFARGTRAQRTRLRPSGGDRRRSANWPIIVHCPTMGRDRHTCSGAGVPRGTSVPVRRSRVPRHRSRVTPWGPTDTPAPGQVFHLEHRPSVSLRPAWPSFPCHTGGLDRRTYPGASVPRGTSTREDRLGSRSAPPGRPASPSFPCHTGGLDPRTCPRAGVPRGTSARACRLSRPGRRSNVPRETSRTKSRRRPQSASAMVERSRSFADCS